LTRLNALSPGLSAGEAPGGLDKIVVQAGLAAVLIIISSVLLPVLLTILLPALSISYTSALPRHYVDIAGYIQRGSLDKFC